MIHQHIIVSGNTLFFDGKTYSCAIGKNGFALDKKEGDNCTPVGIFPLREVWYRADKISAPETQLPLRVITVNDGWCDDVASGDYNQHVWLPLPLGEGWGEGYLQHNDAIKEALIQADAALLPVGEGAQRPHPGGKGTYQYIPFEKIEKARELRQQSTTPEQRLWALLRNRQMQGYKFRRQHPINPYIADFYCDELQLIVEVDGDSHATDDGIAKDEKRTAFLKQQGSVVVRYTNNEIMQNLEGVYEALTLTLSQRERELAALTPEGGGDTRLPHHEKLWREDDLYDVVVVIGYNDAPPVAGKGSAIFMHIAKPDYAGTEGCVALKKADLLEILRHCDAQTQIDIREA